MAVPCSCCAVGIPPRCAVVPMTFDAVAQTSAGAAGWSGPVSLATTIDGSVAGIPLAGYNVAGNPPPQPTPVVDYTMTTARDLVRGVRLYNQGGGDLNDSDGLGPSTVTFLDAGAAPLFTGILAAGNGGAAFDTLIPSGAVLSGVKTVRLSNLGKLTAGSVSPLWREFQLLQLVPAFACRRRDTGALEWYTEAGTLVPAAGLTTCTAPVPLMVPLLTMTETALGDDPGLGERICNVVPAVTSFTGYTLQPGTCYDGSAANSDTLNWAGPLSSVSMSYESNGSASAGASLVAFSAPSIGTVTWPANGVKMLTGEVRTSNPLLGGGHATITYLAPAGAPAIGAPSQDGGPNIRLGPAAIQAFTPYHFRIDFFAP